VIYLNIFFSNAIIHQNSIGFYDRILEVFRQWGIFLFIPLITICDRRSESFTVATMTWWIVWNIFHKWPRIVVLCHYHNTTLSSFMTYHRMFYKSNTTGTTSGTSTDYHSWAHEYTRCLSGVRVAQIFRFLVVFCTPLFLFLSFFFLAIVVSVLRIF
jgi:hypothetical protein